MGLQDKKKKKKKKKKTIEDAAETQTKALEPLTNS